MLDGILVPALRDIDYLAPCAPYPVTPSGVTVHQNSIYRYSIPTDEQPTLIIKDYISRIYSLFLYGFLGSIVGKFLSFSLYGFAKYALVRGSFPDNLPFVSIKKLNRSGFSQFASPKVQPPLTFPLVKSTVKV